MKKLIVLFFLFCLNISLLSQSRIILDTDFGGDADDLGALAMLHHFIDKNEIELLAIMSCSLEKYTVSAIDAVNNYYGHPNILIGTRKGDTYFVDWNYNKVVTENFSFKLNYENVPDATILYRKILAGSADTSITVVTIGPLANIKNLLESNPDSLSGLNGKELIKRKVKKFVIMGGQFPEGPKEWNFDGNMPGVTKFVIENIDVPVVFVGYEIGVDIKTGSIFNNINPKSPLHVGFMHFSKNAPWIKENFKGAILNNSSYDQAAVLYSVRSGEGIYWDKISDGFCLPDGFGGNKWVKNKSSNHSYLKLKMDNKKMASLIDSLMLGKF